MTECSCCFCQKSMHSLWCPWAGPGPRPTYENRPTSGPHIWGEKFYMKRVPTSWWYLSKTFHIWQAETLHRHLRVEMVNTLTVIEAETKWPTFCSRYFQTHFLEWKLLILIQISLKFVPRGPLSNNPALVQIMAWCRTGDKPLSEPKMAPGTGAYVQHWPQWVKAWR